MGEEPGLNPGDLSERVRFICSLDVCGVCYALARVV